MTAFVCPRLGCGSGRSKGSICAALESPWNVAGWDRMRLSVRQGHEAIENRIIEPHFACPPKLEERRRDDPFPLARAWRNEDGTMIPIVLPLILSLSCRRDPVYGSVCPLDLGHIQLRLRGGLAGMPRPDGFRVKQAPAGNRGDLP